MKKKCLVLILALASISVAQAEKVSNLPSTEPAVATAVAAEGNELEMFRFALEMDKEAFVKKSMALDAAQEKKFLDAYYVFNAKLVKLNEKRLAIIADYVSNFDTMTDAKADKLAKATFDFRTQRTALNAAYYKAVAKATTKIIAARAMQVENILQGAGDVAIGSKLPLILK
jgi:hypothetical protein